MAGRNYRRRSADALHLSARACASAKGMENGQGEAENASVKYACRVKR